MILVLSTGRSGTSSLARWLGRSNRLHAVHEAAPLLIDEVVDCVRGTSDPHALAEILRSGRQPTVNGREYAESNHILSYVIPAVEEAFPGVRYVWLVRDGRDVVTSLLARRHFVDQPAADVRGGWLMDRFRGSWFGDLDAAAWDALSPFEKACWFWEKTNAILESELAALPPGRWSFVRLEDPGATRATLVTALGLHDLASVRVPIANQSRLPGDGWQGWSAPERDTFARLCGARMDRHYPGWRTPTGEWRPTFRPSLGTRVQLRVQRGLRRLVFGEGAGSWVLLRAGRRLPLSTKERLRSWLGVA